MAKLRVTLPRGGRKICTEVQTEGHTAPYGSGTPSWYIDAAWLEETNDVKVRDLTDVEIRELEEDHPGFAAAVGEAYSEWHDNYDPTP